MEAKADVMDAKDVMEDKATVVLCVGMAGSGKTTFMQRMAADLAARGAAPFVVNLDPAVLEVPFPTNIDIRDTVNYREVMRQYRLGPNGAILTALNLFTTKFDEVLAALPAATPKDDAQSDAKSDDSQSKGSEKEEKDGDNFTVQIANNEHNAVKSEQSQGHVLVDTPGQIEIFTWSASGAIITEALATQHPVVVAYVVDTPRCDRPATFMSNMLYACSIMYKTRLPLVVVFNKTDVRGAERCLEWMSDALAFQEAVAAEGLGTALPGDEYMAPMVQSMGLVLEEFYRSLRTSAVSAYTGAGMDDFWAAVGAARGEFVREYVPEMRRRAEALQRTHAAREDADLVRLMADLRHDSAAE